MTVLIRYEGGQRDSRGVIASFGVLSGLPASTGSFPVHLILTVVFVIILTVVQTASATFLQENTQTDLIGRVFGLCGAVYSLALPLGMIVFGPPADFVSLKPLMILSGLALFCLAPIPSEETRDKIS